MIDQPIESFDESFLESLRERRVSEIKTIEYKLALPGANDEAHVEFLADVSSFANASGGYLFYGIRAEGGIPVDVCGISGVDPDQEILAPWVRSRQEQLEQDVRRTWSEDPLTFAATKGTLEVHGTNEAVN